MKHYIAAIDTATAAVGGGWYGYFPGIDGLSFIYSGEDGLRGAIDCATRSLRLCAENAEMPEPLTLSEVTDGFQFDQQPVLAAIPLFMDDNRTVKITITMPADIKEAVDYTAKQRGQTRSGFMVSAAKAAMEGKG